MISTILAIILTINPFKIDTVATLSDWMKSVRDDSPMCMLSIPATHDSGALYGRLVGTKTQDMDIAEQLEGGIRGFDIRLRASNISKKLGLYHSVMFQFTNWEDDILPTFISFLREHPSETLIVTMKCEGGDIRKYEERLIQSLQDPDNAIWFVQDFRSDITLGECRGKILFLHRDKAGDNYPGALCRKWQDNSTFEMEMAGSDGEQADVSIEDIYFHQDATHAAEKAELTFEHMKMAMQASPDAGKWFISYASATAMPKAGPEEFSDIVNPWLAEKMSGIRQNCGILFIDYVGSAAAKELVLSMIQSNEYLKR